MKCIREEESTGEIARPCEERGIYIKGIAFLFF